MFFSTEYGLLIMYAPTCGWAFYVYLFWTAPPRYIIIYIYIYPLHEAVISIVCAVDLNPIEVIQCYMLTETTIVHVQRACVIFTANNKCYFSPSSVLTLTKSKFFMFRVSLLFPLVLVISSVEGNFDWSMTTFSWDCRVPTSQFSVDYWAEFSWPHSRSICICICMINAGRIQTFGLETEPA